VRQVQRCSRLRPTSRHDRATHATAVALRCAASRVLALKAEAETLEDELTLVVEHVAPGLLELPGVGPITVAQPICSWSHQRRIRSEGAFAKLAGAAPSPASSGPRIRCRLNRGGDRQLNRALHTIALSRLAHCPRTRAYAQRRTAQGKTRREIQRCLKRYIAREIYSTLQRLDAPPHPDRAVIQTP
jgi:transposase